MAVIPTYKLWLGGRKTKDKRVKIILEQKTILTKFQQQLLDIILKEPYLLKNYYWTGGTALSEIYLHHRESYDIDLFTEKSEVHLPSIEKLVKKIGNQLKSKKIGSIRYTDRGREKIPQSGS